MRLFAVRNVKNNETIKGLERELGVCQSSVRECVTTVYKYTKGIPHHLHRFLCLCVGVGWGMGRGVMEAEGVYMCAWVRACVWWRVCV